MNIAEEALIKKLIEQYRKTGKTEFDPFECLFTQLDNLAVKTLAAQGYVYVKDNILGTIRLTERAIKEFA